jgi:hypothetical protein
MIYINAKGGQEVKITQAIKVALPTGYLDSSMKLFKGEPDADGNINWTNPVPLSENPQLTSIERGKILFMGKCAGCHAIGKDMAGPGLANIMKRQDIFSEGGGYPDMHDRNYSDRIGMQAGIIMCGCLMIQLSMIQRAGWREKKTTFHPMVVTIAIS